MAAGGEDDAPDAVTDEKRRDFIHILGGAVAVAGGAGALWPLEHFAFE